MKTMEEEKEPNKEEDKSYENIIEMLNPRGVST